MRKKLHLIATMLMILSTAVATAAPITDTDFIKAKGRNLRKNKGTGEIVQLKGTNLGGWLIQEFWMTPTTQTTNVKCERDIYNMLTTRFGEEKMEEIVGIWQDNYLTSNDFDNMAAMGMNCVRLPFWWRNITDASGNLKSNWYARLDWAIAQAKARGMYVVVDFHGAPGSQNGSDHSGVDGGDNKQGESKFFFGDNNVANQNLYYDLWEEVAKRYKNEPAVAGYDLLNEPYCTYRYNSGYSADQLHAWLWNIYDLAYKRIRAVDPDHVIIMEATWDPVDLPDPATYGWTNVMYEYHNYEYSDYDNTAGKQITSMTNKINNIRNAAYNVPSYMGEFCYFNKTATWETGLELLNSCGISWTTWTYKVISSYGNWGLVNQNVSSINFETDDEETLRTKCAAVSSSYNNTDLVNTVSTYFKKSAVKNNLGPDETDDITYESMTAELMEISQVTAPQLAGWTRYEAELATISGGKSEAQSFYSGGYGAGSLNNSIGASDVAADWSNIHHVQFNVNVPADGRYLVLLQYNGDDDKYIMTRTSKAQQIVRIPSASAGKEWNKMHVALLDIPMIAGANTLYISGTVGNVSTWLNIDCIDVCRIPLSTNGETTRYEAEYGVIKPNRAVGEEQQSFYSNGWGVGGLGSDVALANVSNDLSNVYYVQFPVFAYEQGSHTIKLAYNGNGATMTAKYRLNNGDATTYTMNNGGKSWNDMNSVTLEVSLNAGMNSITIAGSSTGSWDDWVNFDYIDVRKGTLTAVKETEASDNEVRIFPVNNGIAVYATTGTDVVVYTLMGHVADVFTAEEGTTVRNLEKGFYIVRAGANAAKIFVK